MKTISIIGENKASVMMFTAELAWVLSKENEVFYHIKNNYFYERLSEKGLDSTTMGNLTIINSYNEVFLKEDIVDFFITNEYSEEADLIIFALTQNIFSSKVINRYSQIESGQKKVIVFLDFIDCEFDDEYFKKYHLNKDILSNVTAEFYIDFDERVAIYQLENQLNRFISLKKYPRRRKQSLLSISDYIEGSEKRRYRNFFKDLDKRVSLC